MVLDESLVGAFQTVADGTLVYAHTDLLGKTRGAHPPSLAVQSRAGGQESDLQAPSVRDEALDVEDQHHKIHRETEALARETFRIQLLLLLLLLPLWLSSVFDLSTCCVR